MNRNGDLPAGERRDGAGYHQDHGPEKADYRIHRVRLSVEKARKHYSRLLMNGYARW